NPAEHQGSLDVFYRLFPLLLPDFLPIDIELAWIDPLSRHGPQTILHAAANLPFDKSFGYGEFVGIDDLVQDPAFGCGLGFLLALCEQSLANGIAKLIYIPIISQVLGEFIVNLG